MIDFIIETDDRYIDIYLRLSRDDRTKGLSISIENQDRMLTKFAKEHHYVVRHRYIDDGESGYSFDRPAFDQLKEHIAQGHVKRLLMKDMSRLGRHNARALLFMEESKDFDCEVIALDDNYSNFQDNDSAIGIKTWHNELYVKESSKKVKNVIHMKQEDGEWLSTPPYGYRKKQSKKSELEIEPDNAKIVKRIFDMYAEGKGMLAIARILTKENVITPSKYLHEIRMNKGIVDKRKFSNKWNDQCIRRILSNETYLGTLIQHKGECKKIRGKYQQLGKEKWKIFENHHEAIIDMNVFRKCQERLNNKSIRAKRTRNEYDNVFHGLLFCGDCDNLLKPFRTPKDKRLGNTRYYCSTYLKHGKGSCSSKVITDIQLKHVVTVFLNRCRDANKEYLEKITLHPISKHQNKQRILQEIKANEVQLNEIKEEMKHLIEGKTKECVLQPERDQIIQETYQSLIDEKIKNIHFIEQEQLQLKQNLAIELSSKARLATALDVLDEMIDKQDYSKNELEILFKKIIVHENYIAFLLNGHLLTNMDSFVEIDE